MLSLQQKWLEDQACREIIISVVFPMVGMVVYLLDCISVLAPLLYLYNYYITYVLTIKNILFIDHYLYVVMLTYAYNVNY